MPAVVDQDHPCYFHGEEPITPDVLRVCFECFHAWTREALILADSVLEQQVIDHQPDWYPKGAPAGQRQVEEIHSCPLCLHDF